MPSVKENKEIERRIDYTIVVDAYGPEERSMGWYYYLHDTIKFPFKAKCIKKDLVSPLKEGEVVEVVGMPPEESCESNMFATIKFADRTMAVPFSQLEPVKSDKATKQAIGDWHYWVARGERF